MSIPRDIPETRTQPIALLCVKDSFDIINRYFSLIQLKQVVATYIRFVTNCKLSKSKSLLIHGPLTVDELQRAMIVLTKIHQLKAFQCELRNLQRDKAVEPHSKILSLNPFLDQNGLLRVGGRLKNAPLSYSQRHYILLSSHDALTDLIIRDQHLIFTQVLKRCWQYFVKLSG